MSYLLMTFINRRCGCGFLSDYQPPTYSVFVFSFWMRLFVPSICQGENTIFECAQCLPCQTLEMSYRRSQLKTFWHQGKRAITLSRTGSFTSSATGMQANHRFRSLTSWVAHSTWRGIGSAAWNFKPLTSDGNRVCPLKLTLWNLIAWDGSRQLLKAASRPFDKACFPAYQASNMAFSCLMR